MSKKKNRKVYKNLEVEQSVGRDHVTNIEFFAYYQDKAKIEIKLKAPLSLGSSINLQIFLMRK